MESPGPGDINGDGEPDLIASGHRQVTMYSSNPLALSSDRHRIAATPGQSAARFVVPSSLSTLAEELVLHHAFVVIGSAGITFVSNATPLILDP